MTGVDRQEMGASYRIVVKGHLDPHRAYWFEGMSMALMPSGETTLAATFVDQAALHGILSRIRDLGLELISVQKVTARLEPDAARRNLNDAIDL